MIIHIEELTFDCIIGILDLERENTQNVIITLEIDYTYINNNYINYADIITFVQEDMVNNKYQLLETALNELAHKLLLMHSEIKTLKLKITKPNIISNAKVSLSNTFTAR